MPSAPSKLSEAPSHRVRVQILQSRATWFFCVAGTILLLLGYFSPAWTIHKFEIPKRDDPSVSRGLFAVQIFDGYATTVTTAYFQEDQTNDNADPFCGSASRPSVFSVAFPALFGSGNDSILSPGLYGLPTSYYLPNRDNDQDDWCEKRNVTLGLGGAAVLLSLIGIVVFLLARSQIAFIVFNLITAALGLAATIVFATWYWDQRDRLDDLNLPEGHDADGGWSLGVFIVGWCFVALAGGLECFAACSKRDNPNDFQYNFSYATESPSKNSAAAASSNTHIV